MKLWTSYLESKGAAVELPAAPIKAKAWAKLSQKQQRSYKLKYIRDHNARIDKSNVLFVFNVGGYVGNSVTLEIGYALAKNKEIYAMYPDQEQGRDVLYKGYCKNPEDLMKAITQ